MSAQFSSWKRVPKSSSSPGTETGPRFWLSSSKVQAHAIRGPKLELRLGSHFWGPVMPILLEQKPHLLTQLVVVFKSKQKNLRSSVLLHPAGVPLKLKVVSERAATCERICNRNFLPLCEKDPTRTRKKHLS